MSRTASSDRRDAASDLQNLSGGGGAAADASDQPQPRRLDPGTVAAIRQIFRIAIEREVAAVSSTTSSRNATADWSIDDPASWAALQRALGDRRSIDAALLEADVYDIIELIGLSAPRRFMLSREMLTDPSTSAGQIESQMRDGLGLSAVGSPEHDHVFLKLQATGLLHKTEAGAIRRVPADPGLILETARSLMETAASGEADTIGVLVVEAVRIADVAGLPIELLLGGRDTRDFGHVIMLSLGGVAAEFWNARLNSGRGPVLIGVEHGVSGQQARLAAEQMTLADPAYGRFRQQAAVTSPDRVASWVEAWGALLCAFSGRDGASSPRIVEAEINPLVVRAETAGVEPGALVPLDGLIRVRFDLDQLAGRSRQSQGIGQEDDAAKQPTSGTASLSESERVDALASMLRPKTVAVAGVSGSRVNSGRVILRNLLAGSFRPDQLAVVKPKAQAGDAIDGVACFPSIADVPFDRVDLYVVAVDASATGGMLADGRGKVAGALLIAGGTSEREEGADLGRQMGDLLDQTRIAAIGPNSLGIVARPAGLDTLFIPESKLPRSTRPAAPLAYVSQSGAFMITRMNRLPRYEPMYAISTGNQLRSGISEVVEAVARDEGVRVLAVYVEGFNRGDGARLCRVAKKLRAEGRTVILYKAGRTAQGAAAASGHTASIAGDAEVCRQLVTEAGVLFAEDFDEFEDLVRLATGWADHPASRAARDAGNHDADRADGLEPPVRIALLSNAGYECVGMADQLGPPLELANLGPAAVERFREVLSLRHIDAIVDVHNPMDITPMADTDVWAGVVETMLGLGRGPTAYAPGGETSESPRPESDERLRNAIAVQGQDPVDVLLVSVVPPAPTLQTLARGPGHREDAAGEEQIAARLNRIVEAHVASPVRGGGEAGHRTLLPTRVCYCVDCGPLYDAFADALASSGLPVFRSSDRAVAAIRRLLANERGLR